MSWEARGGKGRYYVKKQRVGGKVVATYVGCGAAGELAARRDRLDRLAAKVRLLRALVEARFDGK